MFKCLSYRSLYIFSYLFIAKIFSLLFFLDIYIKLIIENQYIYIYMMRINVVNILKTDQWSNYCNWIFTKAINVSSLRWSSITTAGLQIIGLD